MGGGGAFAVRPRLNGQRDWHFWIRDVNPAARAAVDRREARVEVAAYGHLGGGGGHRWHELRCRHVELERAVVASAPPVLAMGFFFFFASIILFAHLRHFVCNDFFVVFLGNFFCCYRRMNYFLLKRKGKTKKIKELLWIKAVALLRLLDA